MESKFTPGPWQSQHRFDWDGILTIIGDVDLDQDGATVFTKICDVDDGRPEAELMANAHLISAAPDLYEALSAALPYIESELDNAAYKRGAVARVVAQMNAAIAKAEGH